MNSQPPTALRIAHLLTLFLAVSLAIAITRPEVCAADEFRFVPDPQTLATIGKAIVPAASGRLDEKYVAQLRKLNGKDREELIRQLYYFWSHAGSLDRWVGAAGVEKALQLKHHEKVVALIPCLDAADHRLRKVVRETIIFLELRNAEWVAPPLLTIGPLLEKGCREAKPLPKALVALIFEWRPSLGLTRLAGWNYSIHPRAWKTVLWAEHVVADAIWRKRMGFKLRFLESIPQAREQLNHLVDYKDWWVRLYAAEIANQHPELAGMQLIDRLKRDEHELVRNAVNRSKTTGKRPPSKRKRGTRPSNGKHSSKSTVKPRKTKRRFPPC